MKRIHIVGCGPRTGTTLMAEMMIACFVIDLHSEHEDSIYTLPNRAGGILLTKRPRDVLVAGPALRRMRNLHIIYMLRDPRDMITSRHGNDLERYWVGLRYWKIYSAFGRRLEGHPRFVTIRYEDLVSRPDEIQAYLMQRIPFLEKRAPFTRYHEVATPSQNARDALRDVRPVDAASVGNWRRHLPRVASQLELHGPITRDLIDFGYELDDSWLLELKGVLPDLSDSHLPEFPTWEFLMRGMRGRHLKAAIAPLRYWLLRSAGLWRPA